MMAFTATHMKAQLSSSQRSFANSLMSFLREEGFSPSLDEDDDIKFKKEGNTYWISISEEGPFYLRLIHGGLDCEEADPYTVMEACNYTNRKLKAGKAYYLDKNKSVSVVCEMFCSSVEDYKYVFYKQLRATDAFYATVKEYYNEHDGGSGSGASAPAPFSFSHAARIASTFATIRFCSARGGRGMRKPETFSALNPGLSPVWLRNIKLIINGELRTR